MSDLFADTTFYIALVSPGDMKHASAVALGGAHRERTITSEYVLIEVGNWLARAGDKHVFLNLLSDLARDPLTRIIPGDHDLFERTTAFYARRLDKDWSFVDCSSFVLMAELGISDALAADRHFTQAGFNALLK